MYKYFVSFSFLTAGLTTPGFCNSFCELDSPIKGHEEIELIEKQIKERCNLTSVTVINFVLV